MSPKKYFQGYNVLVVQSSQFQGVKFDGICQQLTKFGASCITTATINKDRFGLSHIIATNTDFPEYQFAIDHMIPIVTPEWVEDTISQTRLASLRPYSVVPYHFLRGVFATISDDIPSGDRQVLEAIIIAHGGHCATAVTKFTTHVIGATTGSDAFIIASSVPEKRIKCVLPQWVDECIKSKQHVNEQKYLLQGSEYQHLETLNEKVYQQSTDDVEMQIKEYLTGKRFYLSNDLHLGLRMRNVLESLIIHGGGSINYEITPGNENCYIGNYRAGLDYVRASKVGNTVGNMTWLMSMVSMEKYHSPFNNMLHYPVSRTGLPVFDNLIFAATNYSGDGRGYVEALIEGLGAKYSKSLTTKVDYLICSKPGGAKYDAGLLWENVKVRNHHWLEKCYKEWRIVKDDDGMDIRNAETEKDMLGQVSFDEESIRKFWDANYMKDQDTKEEEEEVENSDGSEGIIDTQKNIDDKEIFIDNDKIIQDNKEDDGKQEEILNIEVDEQKKKKDEDKKDEEKKDEEQDDKKQEDKDHDKIGKAEKTDAKELKNNQELKSSKIENGTSPKNIIPNAPTPEYTIPPPIYGGRKAAKKAAEKLHSDMEDLNKFQKQRLTKSIPKLPEEVAEAERLKQLKRKSLTSDIISTPSKKSKSKNKLLDLRIVTTGCDDITGADLRMLQSLGVSVAKDPADGNTIIAPRIMRTEKFLSVLANGPKYILHPKFIEDLVKNGKEIDPEKYSLDHYDSGAKNELGITVEELLKRWQDRKTKLFSGIRFNITGAVPGGPSVLNRILGAHGSPSKVKLLKSASGVKPKQLEYCDDEKTCYLIRKGVDEGSEATVVEKFQQVCEKQKKTGIVVEWQWVVSSIFSSEMS
ncbi:Rtt107 protein [Saccharomycopsis crataegensis]|uniref:Rtt107 protein n=1 Tax=Saccharomycopsis crataegensis TaxID=43959 RepID=A0AAV5QLN7_9ASCO|nr:Rtt107 protein [Saccharomycopsis crataegensis]